LECKADQVFAKNLEYFLGQIGLTYATI
jgi:hypothetical protein